MKSGSAIYAGRVVHRRLKPRRHRLRYSVYWLLLDLDEIEQLSGRLRFFSRNRFNLFSFYDRDYCEQKACDLRGEIVEAIRCAGITQPVARILVLSMPRVMGYVFNPLSVFFCHGDDDRLVSIVYQVHNTFGERHRYILPVEHPSTAPIVQRCHKNFYVSPFLDMELQYNFRVSLPEARIAVTISAHDATGPVLVAALSGARRPLTDLQLARVFVSIPLLTVKVIAGIYWEAVRLWLKRIGLRPHKAARPLSGTTTA